MEVYIYTLFRQHVTYQHLAASMIGSNLGPQSRRMSRIHFSNSSKDALFASNKLADEFEPNTS